MLIMLTSSWQNSASKAKLDVFFISVEGSSCDDNHPKHKVRVIPRQPHLTHINLNMGVKFNLSDFPAIEAKMNII